MLVWYQSFTAPPTLVQENFKECHIEIDWFFFLKNGPHDCGAKIYSIVVTDESRRLPNATHITQVVAVQ